MTPEGGVYEHVSALIRSLHGPTLNVARPPTPITDDDTSENNSTNVSSQNIREHVTLPIPTSQPSSLSHQNHHNTTSRVIDINIQDDDNDDNNSTHDNHHESHFHNFFHFPAAFLGNHHHFRIPMLTVTEPELKSPDVDNGHDHHLNRFFHFAARRLSNTVLF